MPTSIFTKEVLAAAILGFEEQKRQLNVQIAELRAMLAGPAEVEAAPVRRTMSAAGRKAIAEGQRKRWAASKDQSPSAAPEQPKKKRRLSAEGRAAIIAATKRRWAAKRAEGKGKK
jgi:hypothetical protein